MTEKDKRLLLIDLCARLPYGFVVHRYSDNCDITFKRNELDEFAHFLEYSEGEVFKPYLRSMSSMTEEEKRELYNIRPYFINSDDIVSGTQCNTFIQASECQDWLLANHFDFRGLIPMGLALEAKEGMYKIE